MSKVETYEPGGEVFVGLDIGTTKVCCVAAVLNSAGELDIIGVGNAQSFGMRRGVMVDMQLNTRSIELAVEECQQMAGCRIEWAHVGIAGGHVHSQNSHGMVAVADKETKKVTEEDKKRAIAAAMVVNIPVERELIQCVPQDYALDNLTGIADPLNMMGVRLEVNVHIITGAVFAIANIVRCVGVSGLNTKNIILESLASAEAVLTPQEMEVGAAILDIGGGTTDIAVFHEGMVKHSAVIALGGDSLTSDLVVGLKTDSGVAERLKITDGCCVQGMLETNAPIEVPSMGGVSLEKVERSFFCDILEKRCEEILTHAQNEIRNAKLEDKVHQIVLTGGSSLLRGLPELTYQIFNRPARQGYPHCQGGLANLVNDPKYSTAIGLILYGIRHPESGLQIGKNENSGASLFGKIWSHLKNMLLLGS
ncbi:MAG: cell division protein FtsA [Deltaproteobacteria bacterium]|nr:cell division protein FtsA [Deltaproteobacteria bacterium]